MTELTCANMLARFVLRNSASSVASQILTKVLCNRFKQK